MGRGLEFKAEATQRPQRPSELTSKTGYATMWLDASKRRPT